MGHVEGVMLTPLKIIEHVNGDVFHALKNHEASYVGFGEAYFSTVNCGVVKGWKKHREMTLNVIVPIGSIRFIIYDDREGSSTQYNIQEVVLSKLNYQRLTVPPGVWMAFQGLGEETNMLLNIASIPHDPNEAISLPLINDSVPFLFKSVNE